MKIGIICSIPHLKDFAVESDFHLVLPHLYTNPEYLEFYRYRAASDDFVVQDNSIFELNHSLDGEVLIDLACKIGASEMVAPEVLKDSEATKRALEDFLILLSDREIDIQVQAVAQGHTFEELIDHIFWLNTIEEVNTIGLPFDLENVEGEGSFNPYKGIRSLTIQRVLKRWTLVDYIWAEAENRGEKVKPIHLMGLSDGIELQKYTELEGSSYIKIRSNDSSSAFVHGAAGILYNDRGLPCEKISTKLDFNTKLSTSTQFESIFYNIKCIKTFARYERGPITFVT